MPLEALERQSLRDGPLQRLDPRAKLLGTLAFVLTVVATPPGRWRLLAAEGLVLAFALGLAGVQTGLLLKRWLSLGLLVAFLALLIAPSHPLRPALGLPTVAAGIAAKNGLALLAVLTLSAVTPFPKLLSGLRRLGVPATLVETLHFMSRYLHVLRDELYRMVQARRSRSFRRSGRLDWLALSSLIGPLFLRAMERGERVHAAMRARGWDGTLRTLDGDGP